MSTRGEARALLRQRDFRRFVFSLGASEIGNRMTIVALAFAVLDVRDSASAVGIVLGSGSVALLAGLALGGVLGDRLHRRRLMVTCDIARVITQGFAAALVFSGHAELWSLALLAAGTEFGTGIFLPASQGLVQSIVDERFYTPAAGIRAMAISLGEALGPVVGGAVVAIGSPGWGLAADAVTFAASAVALAGIAAAQPAASGDEVQPSTFQQLVDGWAAFRSRRWLWTVIASASVTQFVWGSWNVLGPVVANRHLGGAAVWGAILTGMGVGALVGAALATRVRPSRPLVWFTVMYASFALPIAVLAAGAPALAVGAAAFVAGAAILLGESVWEVTFLRAIPDDLISRMSSYDWFGSVALVPVGLAIWGPVAAWLGTGTALWIGAGIALASSLALLCVPEVRDFRQPAGANGEAPAPDRVRAREAG